MLAIKLAGVTGVEPSHDVLHVSAFIQTADARHLAAGRTGDATHNGTAAVWNEEVLLPVSNEDAPSASSVLLELRGGGGASSTVADGVLGFATIEWAEVKSHAGDSGWGVELPLLSASGKALGAKLLARLLYTDAAGAATYLRDLKGALADAGKGKHGIYWHIYPERDLAGHLLGNLDFTRFTPFDLRSVACAAGHDYCARVYNKGWKSLVSDATGR